MACRLISKRSSTSASAGASCSRPSRSTADSAAPTTTARSASSCCATSRSSGGSRWSRCATTCVGLDAAILGPPSVWEASGHLGAGFADELVDCRNCKERWRADHLGDSCPNCGSKDLTEARAFNLMFKTHVGPVEDSGSVAYLRPETAQGMFINFLNVLQTSRKKPPFGIAQIGKSFRNEITPGNFVFRTREFEQMELEFFVAAGRRSRSGSSTGSRSESLVPRSRHARGHPPHPPSRSGRAEPLLGGHRRHRVPVPLGLGGARGHRPAHRLRPEGHAAFSGEKLEYFDQATNERYVPYVVEPAAGATRTMMAFLMAAYETDEVGGEARVVLRLDPRLAPYKVAVLPLSKKDAHADSAEVLDLQPHFMCDYDETQSIGRRYRRQDEVGTPFCVTVDFETLDDKAVTVRDRDTTEQVRVPIDALVKEVTDRLAG